MIVTPELADAIVAELQDERYLGYSHGRRTAVNLGCRGPLCQKLNRDRRRAIYAKANPTARRIRPGSDSPELDAFLDELIEANASRRQLARTT